MDLENVSTHDASTDTDRFQLENDHTLDVHVEGTLLAKAGSMIGHTGELSFTGKASAEGGITGFLKQAATDEGTPIMEVEGQGHLYLADREKKVQILELGRGESITVNGEDVLAFESRVDYEIGSIDSLAGSFAGGFTNVHLSGPGSVAITTHGDPLVLEPPVSTDPAATVAWSGTAPRVSINRSLGDMFGQESGERFQMTFGDDRGSVVVQPFEELG